MNQQLEGTSVPQKRGRGKRKKKGGGDLGCGGRGLSKDDVWVVGGANAQDPQGWKRPWEPEGVGLRLKQQKGPRRVLHLWSQRAGDLTWEPSRLPGLEWAGQTPPLLSCSSGLGSGKAPPTCLS